MEDTTPVFDAADLADAILGTTETVDLPQQPAVPPTAVPPTAVPPIPAPSAPPRSSMGWVLLFALLLAVGAGVGLAAQETDAEPPPCDGLFPTDCCIDGDHDRDDDPQPNNEPRGLFDNERTTDDAESEFTIQRLRDARDRC